MIKWSGFLRMLWQRMQGLNVVLMEQVSGFVCFVAVGMCRTILNEVAPLVSSWSQYQTMAAEICRMHIMACVLSQYGFESGNYWFIWIQCRTLGVDSCQRTGTKIRNMCNCCQTTVLTVGLGIFWSRFYMDATL